MRTRLIYSALLFAAFVSITMPQMVVSFQSAQGLQFAWTTSKVWLASADCAKATKKFLVLCEGDKVVPIANGFGGDDIGHALALEIYSAVTDQNVVPEQISMLNTTINYAGLSALAMLLFFLRLPISSLAVLTGGTLIANNLHALTPHPAQFGAACFAAILPLAVLCKFRFRAIWVAIGVFTLALAMLFREAIGMMGVVAAIGACAWLVIRSRSIAYPVILVLMTVAISMVPYALLRSRDALYQLPPSEKLESHGTWANLYMGLGGVPNPFGIEWNDYSAIDAVKEVDPSVTYLSPRFYDILRTRYFEILRNNPAEVAKIYVEKLVIVLRTAMPIAFSLLQLWEMLALISAAIILIGWIRIRGNATTNSYSTVIVCAAFTGLFVIQATLISFAMQYLFPVQLFLLMASGAAVDMMICAPEVRMTPRMSRSLR